MKRKLIILLLMLLLVVGGAVGSNTIVQAYGDNMTSDLAITRVEDIEVYNDYIVNDLSINNTIYEQQDGYQLYKFTLESDGFVKLLVSASNVTKTVVNRGVATISDASLTATVYRDSRMMYPVVPSVVSKGKAKGESAQRIALDKGTYYIAIQTDKFLSNVSNNTTTTSVLGKAALIIYYQPVKSNEIYRPSEVGKENPISFDEVYPSLLTATNPRDYYTFNLDEKALIKVNFMYDSLKNAKFVLYGVDREVLVTKAFAGNNVWYNIEKFLEPGKYYCSLETVTPNDGGRTKLQISQTVYPLKLSQENSTVNSYITVETIDGPKEVRFVKGKLTNSELTSTKWNGGKVITEDLKFGVNMTGYYTVRVTDEYNNMFMQSIKVNNCDKKAPGKPTVKGYKIDTFVVTGTAEKGSLVTIAVNGKPYKTIATSKGSYECELPFKLMKGYKIVATAQDVSGNTSAKAVLTVK